MTEPIKVNVLEDGRLKIYVREQDITLTLSQQVGDALSRELQDALYDLWVEQYGLDA